MDDNSVAQAAAVGYDRLGLDASEAEYEAIAEEVCATIQPLCNRWRWRTSRIRQNVNGTVDY
ncbi:MAG: hypothetical protein LBB94_11910 [Clostridiales bacterium]|nr:hypothetical protein [Clostridiales bacterium]